MEREKIIKGLECCIKRDPDDHPRCDECPYEGACLNRLKNDALVLLKAQEPQVMTLNELLTAENCMEPVFLEIRDASTTPDVFSWRTVKHINPLNDKPIFVLDCVGFSSALYTETYGYLWRCWTSRPTDAQREAVKWE